MNDIYRHNLEKDNVELIRGKAEFTGAREVTVGGATYTADHIIIATGGHPTLLDIPGEVRALHVRIASVNAHTLPAPAVLAATCVGKELMITSDGFFELEELPR